MSPVEKYIARKIQSNRAGLAVSAVALVLTCAIVTSFISNAFSYWKHREQVAAYRECLASRHQLLTEMPEKVERRLWALECRL